MAIYCIILSAQHKCCSMSVSVPTGTEKGCPWRADKTPTKLLIPKCAQHSSYSSGLLYDAPVDDKVHMSVFVCVSVCMCVFPRLCLYIPCVNRVVSSCPWICIDREYGICWVFLSISLCERAGGGFVGYNKVTQWRVTLCCYRWLLWPNAKDWVAASLPPLMERHCMWQE